MAGKKKKILLLSDDMRMFSGVGIMSKEFVLGTIHKYDWVQIAGAINHPEHGEIVDMNESVANETGVKDVYLKLYPINGYGDPHILRQIMEMEKPDAILHFTDPRQWIWLYGMEHEIRQNIPILYYNIWDDLPDPQYNRDFYRSCDVLMGISKQTYGINKRILKKYDYSDWQITYVPHGINKNKCFKIKEKADTRYNQFQQKYGFDRYKFKILYVNRNIRRKMPGDVVLAYKHMMDKLTPEQRKECCLIFHTSPVDENGTDLPVVCSTLIPEYNVVFPWAINEGKSFSDEELNFLYNSTDVYINIASNEGFGLGSCEALHTGTPIIVNVTGGLQDQCGFKKEDGTYLTADDYVELGSNHTGRYKEHGEWVKPVFPSNRSLQGSPLTPYIFDDRAKFEDAGEALLEWYKAGSEERERCGELGRQFVLGDDSQMDAKKMSELFIRDIDTTFEKWTPKEKYTLEVV